MGTTTLYPTADSQVFQYYPDSNYGSGPTMDIITRIGRNCRGFLKFDLSSLPEGASITSATLRCYCYAVVSLVSGVTDTEARRVADDTWTESGITWNNQPAYGNLEDTKVPAVGWVEWTVTAYVQQEWAGDKTVSMCLKCVTESYDNTYRYPRYATKEYDTYDPELVVAYSAAYTVTVSEVLGMADSVASPAAFKVTVSESLGMVESAPRKAAYKQAVSEILGMLDSAARQKAMYQTISEVLGMLDSATRSRGLPVTISEILGMRDSAEARKHVGRLGDLPDHYREGGA